MASAFADIDVVLLLEHLYARTELPSSDLSRPWHVARAPGQAFKSSERSGKWCIFRPEAQIDDAWRAVKEAVEQGSLIHAKVSTALRRGTREHVICVYTVDYADAVERLTVRGILKEMGFTEVLGYKRDVDTRNGIYGPGEWFDRA